MSATILTSLGLVLVIEGLTYALVPSQIKRMMQQMLNVSDEQLRTTGTVVLAIGVLIVWVARHFIGV
jgi:uncharacterized protein